MESSSSQNPRRRSRKKRSGRKSYNSIAGNSQGNGAAKRSSGGSSVFLWLGRLLVFAMIIVAPWWIASVNMLAQFVLITTGVVAVALWWFVLILGRRSSHIFPFLAFPVILGLVLIGIQMIPISGNVKNFLAGQQSDLYERYASPCEGELLENAEFASEPTTRITMDLDGSIRAFNLLSLALICLLLGAHFFRSRRSIVLLPLIGTLNGVAISFFGIVQKMKFDGRLYWFIELRYGGLPFGPFVNRNNAAGFLLICFGCSLMLLYLAFSSRSEHSDRPRQIITNEYPIWKRLGLQLMLFISEINGKKLAAIIASVFILLGIVSTFSRGATIALIAALVPTIAYVAISSKSKQLVGLLVIAGVLVVALVSWLGFASSFAERMGSLSEADILSTDDRVQHWIQTAPAITDFAPSGSGVGSYVNVHRLYRIDSENKLFYHAENQYFQTLVEAGYLGFTLLILALVILGLCVRFLALHANSSKTTAVCVLGLFVLASQSIAAFFDFGLYIPANIVMLATICGFVCGQTHALAERLKKKYFFRYHLPHAVTLIFLIVIFSSGVFSALTSYRLAKIDGRMGDLLVDEDYQTLDLTMTNQRIDSLTELVSVQPTSASLKRLAELWIHRYRLNLFDQLSTALSTADRNNAEKLQRLWWTTSIDRLHALIHQAIQAGDQRRVRMMRQDPLVRENLLRAVYFLKQSRGRSPLQPSVHILLAQLHSLSEDPEADHYHLVRARELAPANAVIWYLGGVLELQAGRTESAQQAFKRALQISSDVYLNVIRISAAFMAPDVIFKHVLPDSPTLLISFAKSLGTTESEKPLKLEVLRHIEKLLEKAGSEDQRSLQIKVEVQLGLGKLGAAIETLELAHSRFPDSKSIRRQLVRRYRENGQPEQAIEHADWLVRRGESQFEQVLKQLNDQLKNRELQHSTNKN